MLFIGQYFKSFPDTFFWWIFYLLLNNCSRNCLFEVWFLTVSLNPRNVGRKYIFQRKQELQQTLTITVGEIIHASVLNLNQSNIYVQQDYFSKKKKIWLLYEVSLKFSSGRKTFRLCLCFTLMNVNKIFVWQ